MLTFFTTAKPFRGHDGLIQQNALKSWKRLRSDIEIILFGDDEGAAEIAQALEMRHEPRVERSESGAKRLDTMFGRAQEIAQHDLLCYINCDIILMRDFCPALERVKAKHKGFLMVGRRWDTEIHASCDFENKEWEARLRKQVLRERKQRTPDWIDYFVFSRGLYGADFPPLVVGRVFWDNWLVWKALDRRCPVVDVSNAVMAVHQNHDYRYHPQGKQGVFCGVESGRNYQLAGGWNHLRTIADATEVLNENKLKPNRLRYWAGGKRYARQAARVFFYGGMKRAWFFLLGLTRPLRRMLGLRAENLHRWRGKASLYLGKQG
jgi:hypothetical protein